MKLVLLGDSWCEGVWNICNHNQLKLIHSGMALLFQEKGYKVVNLGKGGSSLWQLLHRLHLYLSETNNFFDTNLKIILFQTKAERKHLSEVFDVDYNEILKKSSDVEDFYLRVFDIFYIKLNEIALSYNIKIYLAGALTDLNTNLLLRYSNLEVITESWIKLLYPHHKVSTLPVVTDSEFIEEIINLKHYQIANELIDLADKKIISLQSIIESEYFDQKIGNFHPNLLGHQRMAEHIIDFFNKDR